MTKPILFNTEMVRAILDGRKTVTRRVVKPQPEFAQIYEYKGETLYCGEERVWCFANHVAPDCFCECDWLKQFAPYRPGDILYVRETYGTYSTFNGHSYAYKGDYIDFENSEKAKKLVKRWIPSIHMPKEAARIFLRVTDVRVERLQEIDVDGSIAEGAWGGGQPNLPFSFLYKEHPKASCNAVASFAHIWDSTIKPSDLPLYGWEASPWVWVIEFERISKEDAYNA